MFDETGNFKTTPKILMAEEKPQKDIFPQNEPGESISGAHLLGASHYRMLSLTAEVGNTIIQNNGLENILQRCVEAISCHLGLPFARIWVKTIHGQSFDLKASTGDKANSDETDSHYLIDQFSPGDGPTARTPVIKNDLINDPGFPDKKWAEKEGVAAFAGFPLIVGNDLVGILGLFSETALFQSDLQFMLPVTDQIALCIVRKQAEDALKKSEATLKSIFLAAPTGIGFVSDRLLLDVNQRLCQMTGYSREELMGQSARMLYPTQKEFEWVGREKYQQISKSGTGTVETRWVRKDGRIIDVLLSSTPLEPSDLKAGVTFTVLDISDRKRAEQALRESEDRFRSAFEYAPGPISMNSPGGGFMMVNRAMCDLLGYSEKGLIPLNVQEMVHPDDANVFREHMTLLLDGKTRMASFESRFTHKTGRVIPGYSSITLLRAETGEPLHFVIHIQDISQRKSLEKQMLEVQKMKAISTLAGGIAHDFNNLLMAIQGRVSLILMDLDAAHPHWKHLNTIESHIQSAATLTRELLGFARGGKYAARPTDLNEFLKNIAQMFGRTRKEICIRGIYQPNLWNVDVDHRQIRQAFMNIFINAWQAMGRGGDLTIETRNMAGLAGVTCPDYVRPGNFIRISLTDTGVGMDEKTRQRIFEPFFTTRQMGKGTGMALAATYGIIRNHGGFITVESEPGKGSTFFVFLPASDRSEGKTDDTIRRSDGNETILIVDDDEIIIEVGKQLLENSGYQVIAARGGREAIEKYNEMKHLIDLVILDMVMPHPNGEETLRELKKIDENVKVIVSSGYCLDSNQPPLRNLDYQKFIQKPFKLSELSRAIREVLEFKG